VHGVVTRKGKPVADAEVSIGRQFARSDAAGEYKKVTVGEGSVRFDIELDYGGRVSGVVVDQGGAPVPGVYVVLRDKHGDEGRGTTDENGRFEAHSMTGGGPYVPHVYPWEGARGELASASGTAFSPVEVPDSDAHVTGVKLAIELEKKEIAGRVVDSTGKPIAAARVRALESAGDGEPMFNPWMALPSATTAVDGSFRLSGLKPGAYVS
jgi:protocatechuate 3,4-dioxygenase beta subunit